MNKKRIKSTIKKLVPDVILKPLGIRYRKIREKERLKKEDKLILRHLDGHKERVEKVRTRGGVINVVFFALMDSVWKYDILYQRMANDSRFNPVILVCPVVNYGRENMLRNMDRCYSLFKSKGYNVQCSYDTETNTYIDVETTLKPDVIFYTNPYEGLIDDRYFIKKFPHILTCYTNYSIPQSQAYKLTYDSLFSNLLWKFYMGFSYQPELAARFSRIKASNAVYSGFPGTDKYLKARGKIEDEWKIKDKKVKRIIWAPHHTITDYAFVTYSTFLDYYEFMFEMAKKYQHEIQITFKPHPLLKNRLIEMWGKDKMEEYYQRWQEVPNGTLNDGEYENLFLTSDAIIHDCGSFIAEYLFTRKPAMFLSNGRDFKEQYNDFAIDCLNNYYIGRSKEDIEKFIVNLIAGTDPIKEKREVFFQKELLPPNGKLASENILEDLIKELIPEKK